jgi:hypothetical protein
MTRSWQNEENHLSSARRQKIHITSNTEQDDQSVLGPAIASATSSRQKSSKKMNSRPHTIFGWLPRNQTKVTDCLHHKCNARQWCRRSHDRGRDSWFWRGTTGVMEACGRGQARMRRRETEAGAWNQGRRGWVTSTSCAPAEVWWWGRA